jgi:hypothetical protein
MTDSSQMSTHSLTGVWNGIYSYPSRYGPVSFVAILIEAGSSVSGTTHEPCVRGNCPSDTLYATLTGSRQGSVVAFAKVCEGGSPHYDRAIEYQGTLSADGTEIEGRWSIPGDWSGQFLMIRSSGTAVTVKRKVFERA